jgi:hypothetical protein
MHRLTEQRDACGIAMQEIGAGHRTNLPLREEARDRNLPSPFANAPDVMMRSPKQPPTATTTAEAQWGVRRLCTGQASLGQASG